MKNYWIASLFLTVLFACGPSGQQGGNGTGERLFRTTAPSLLYFKNMRSSYYRVEEQPQSRIELYRSSRFEETAYRPIIYPIIVNNWLEDEAYLFLQPNEYEGGYLAPLTFAQDTLPGSERFLLQPATPLRQRELGLLIYDGLLKGEPWYVAAADSALVPLFRQGSDRQAFLSTVQDYLRLTEQD